MAGFCAAPCCQSADDAEPQSLPLTDPVKEDAEVEEKQVAAVKLEKMRVEKEPSPAGQQETATPAPPAEEPPKAVEEPKEEEAPKAPVPEAPALETTTTTTWVYKPINGKMIEVRHEPRIGSEKAGIRLNPGQAFDVIEERREDQITFLKLKDGTGWVFDLKPGVGKMCVRKEEADAMALQELEQQEQQASAATDAPQSEQPPSDQPPGTKKEGGAGCKCIVM